MPGLMDGPMFHQWCSVAIGVDAAGVRVASGHLSPCRLEPLPIPDVRQDGPDQAVGVDVVDGWIAVTVKDDQRQGRARVGWRPCAIAANARGCRWAASVRPEWTPAAA